MNSENNKKAKTKKRQDYNFSILMLQIYMAMIFILIAYIIKNIGGNFYFDCKAVYYNAINSDTSPKEVLENQPVSEEKVVVESVGYPEEKILKSSGSNVVSSSEESFESANTYSIDLESVKQNINTSSSIVNVLVWPVNGIITSEFGYRTDPINGNYSFHGGLDIAANSGTEIKAASQGEVIEATYNDFYGNYIILSHGENLKTVYAHCSKLSVEKGQTVSSGQIIAFVGTTGRSTGPHLHFETRIGNSKTNPLWLLPKQESI